MLARNNPFATERVHALGYLAENATADELLDRWIALGRRAEIVGPEGHGKTTLLYELAASLASGASAARVMRVARGQRRLTATDLASEEEGSRPPSVYLVDSAEQLSRRGFAELLAAGGGEMGLLLTRHRPSGKLPTLLRCRTSPELLRRIVHRLVPEFSEIAGTDLDRLYRRHGGDLRAALRALYDLWAGRPDSVASAG